MINPTPSRRGICLATLAMIPILTPGSAWAAASDCRPGLRYDGPPLMSPPAGLDQLPRPSRSLATATDPDFIAVLEGAADRIAAHAPALSLAIAHPELGLWQSVRGTSPGNRFAAASIGKSMTAVVIFQLADEGRLQASDTLDRWFPDLPSSDLVTLDQLLTHTSGYFLPATAPLGGPYTPPERDFERLRDTGPVFCPGTNWAYSNVGYQLLGRVIEAVDGRRYGDSLQARILEPLGLDATHVLQAGTPDPVMVTGHTGGEPVGPVDYATPFAAGPVSSTAGDLVRYWSALLAARITSTAALTRMTQTLYPMFGQANAAYGRGLQVSQVEGPGLLVHHSGGVTGFTAGVAWLAEDDLVIAAMTNDRDVPAEAAIWSLTRALRDA